MKKTFIYLANSKKYGERCIAGVEIANFDGASYSIVINDSQPKWIRPVSKGRHGAVSAKVVGKVKLLDIVEIDVISECPRGYQSENAFFDEASLKIAGQLEWTKKNVARFRSRGSKPLFGNNERAVHVHAINQLTYSLVLINPDSVKFKQVTYPNGNSQVRASFVFQSVRYDLPITDLDFCSKFYEKPGEFNSYSDFFLTISLGVEFNSFHYKLVAAVFYF